jgi:hypothetical protein
LINRSSANSGCLRGLLVAGLIGFGVGWGLNALLLQYLQSRVSDENPAPRVVSNEPSVTSDRPRPIVLAPGIIEEKPAIEAPTINAETERPAHEQSATEAIRPSTQKERGENKSKESAPPEPTDDAPSSQPEIRVFSVDRAALKRRFKEPSDLWGHGRYLPNVQDGVRRGLRFVDVAPGGIFARLGIKTGDVVLSVNGAPLNTQQDVLANFQKMRKMHTLNFLLERDGRPVRHRYILK